MTVVAYVLIGLGEIALWLDLGNRLFGSYVRSPTRVATRMTLIVVVLLALATPLCWHWIDPASGSARVALWLAALLGGVAFVHFLIPYRWGIVRVSDRPTISRRVLVPGIVLTSGTIDAPGLPEAADGMTCLLMSDLHCNSERQLALIRGAIERLEDKQPDVMFLLGDFGERKSLLPEVVATVTRLSGRWGTYCVLGNHDYEGGRKGLLVNLLHQRDVNILADRFQELPELQISLLGLAHPCDGVSVVPQPRDGFVLGLAHSPDNLPTFERRGAAVAFAGHTHGGKYRVPGLGAILIASKLGRFLDEGWFRRGKTLLYVTRGIGYFPGRRGNVGEVCWFTLRTQRPTHLA